jgi:hypothetical protein
VALEGEQGIVAHHTATVIGDLDELFAASLDLKSDASGACIKRIFEQLFYDRGGTFYDFAGSDFVGDMFRKNVDAAHAIERKCYASFAEKGREGKGNEPTVRETSRPIGANMERKLLI